MNFAIYIRRRPWFRTKWSLYREWDGRESHECHSWTWGWSRKRALKAAQDEADRLARQYSRRKAAVFMLPPAGLAG